MTTITPYLNKFSSLTGFIFKTVVIVPAVTIFVLFSLVSYSSGGIGNALIEMDKLTGYKAQKSTYRTCLDRPVTLEAPQNIVQATKKFELKIPSAPKVTPECQTWGDVSAEKKASLLTSSISRFYASIVLMYWLSLMLLKLFKSKAVKII